MVVVTNSSHGLGPVHWGWDSPMGHFLCHEIKAGLRINPAAFPALDSCPPNPISAIEQQIHPGEVNVQTAQSGAPSDVRTLLV